MALRPDRGRDNLHRLAGEPGLHLDRTDRAALRLSRQPAAAIARDLRSAGYSRETSVYAARLARQVLAALAMRRMEIQPDEGEELAAHRCEDALREILRVAAGGLAD